MSDDELPSEEQLKLRKPEKRGLRSRNPNGLSSRRDREREEGGSRESRWGGREEERERNPMDMVRGAYMDGDRKKLHHAKKYALRLIKEIVKPQPERPNAWTGLDLGLRN